MGAVDAVNAYLTNEEDASEKVRRLWESKQRVEKIPFAGWWRAWEDADIEALLNRISELEDAFHPYVTCGNWYKQGWRPRRDGLGFLRWNKGNDWITMSEAEASIVLEWGL